jgi:hypothetical protein
MYCASCEVRTECMYICYIEERRSPIWSIVQSSCLHNGDVLCFLWGTNWIYICYVEEKRPPMWSEFLATDPEVLVWFPELPDFLRSSGSVTESTQPREYNRGAIWKKKWRLLSINPRIRPRKSVLLPRNTLYLQKVGNNFAEKRRSLGRYSSHEAQLWTKERGTAIL